MPGEKVSTYWLNEQLKGKAGIVTDGGNPVLSVSFNGRTERIYCPSPDEYRVTADVVRKAQRLGATIVAYSSSWGTPTYEGKTFGETNRISVMSYASFFAFLRQHGIDLTK